MKILVMGYSGAGKSTVAQILGRKHHCPVLHLDTVQFRENWQEREAGEAEKLAEEFLENRSWVIDGNYMGRFSFARRCREADWIILLLLPRHICLYRALKRYWQNRGRVRDSMAAGCEEKMDWEFIRWILWEGRRKEYRNGFRRLAEENCRKTLVCKSARRAAAVADCLFLEEKGKAPIDNSDNSRYNAT